MKTEVHWKNQLRIMDKFKTEITLMNRYLSSQITKCGKGFHNNSLSKYRIILKSQLTNRIKTELKHLLLIGIDRTIKYNNKMWESQ